MGVSQERKRGTPSVAAAMPQDCRYAPEVTDEQVNERQTDRQIDGHHYCINLPLVVGLNVQIDFTK